MMQATTIYGIMERGAAETLISAVSREKALNLKIEAKGDVAAVLGPPARAFPLQRRKRRQKSQQAHYLRILERMMEEGAVLPAPFAQSGLSKRRLHALLNRHKENLSEMLSSFGSKVEIGITVKWDVGQFVHRALSSRSTEDVTGEAGPQLRKVSGLQEEILLEQLRLRQDLLDQLAPLIVDRLVEKTAGLDNVLTARLLVDLSDEQSVYDTLTKADMTANGLRARFHGPLPPLSFVSLKSLFDGVLDAGACESLPQAGSGGPAAEDNLGSRSTLAA